MFRLRFFLKRKITSEKGIEIKSEEVLEEQENNKNEESLSKEDDKTNMRVFPWSWEDFEQYKYGDLHMWCRNCGKDNPMNHPSMKNMQTAMPINPVPVDNNGIIALGCENCGSQLVLHFRKSTNPPTPEEEAEMEKEMKKRREEVLSAENKDEDKKEEVETKEEK